MAKEIFRWLPKKLKLTLYLFYNTKYFLGELTACFTAPIHIAVLVHITFTAF